VAPAGEREQVVIDALAAAGHVLERVPALQRQGSPLPGGVRLEWHGTEIVFRVLASGEVLILLYRRSARVPTLRNPFRALVGFLGFLAERRQALGLVRVFGRVETAPYRADGGLDDTRLARFYTDFLGGEVIGPDGVAGFSAMDRRVYKLLGTSWISLDLVDFRPVAEVVARRRGRAGQARRPTAQ
jgi:type III secretion system regulator LcrR